MAKSIRSKSLQKAKAVRREKIFKPVAIARAQRLARLDTVIETEAADKTEEDVVMKDQPSAAPAVASERKRGRYTRKTVPFNRYGLSRKEARF